MNCVCSPDPCRKEDPIHPSVHPFIHPSIGPFVLFPPCEGFFFSVSICPSLASPEKKKTQRPKTPRSRCSKIAWCSRSRAPKKLDQKGQCEVQMQVQARGPSPSSPSQNPKSKQSESCSVKSSRLFHVPKEKERNRTREGKKKSR